MVNIIKYTCFNSNAKLMHVLTTHDCRNNLCGSIKNHQHENTVF